MVTVLAVVAAFAAGTAATGWLAARGWLLDRPNERSLHDRPVPRSGGLAILAGIAGGLAILTIGETPAPAGYGWLIAGALAIACVSFLDDTRRVSPAIRFVSHLAAAACVVLAGLSSERIALPGAVLDLGSAAGTAFTVLLVAWIVNLYNFMDGMDGLAGGMTVIGFTALAVLGLLQGAGSLAAAAAVTAAAAAGFLLFNFPPAKIFMGDLGSSLLGYLCVVAMLWAERATSVPLWTFLLLFSPFIVDASITLARRSIAGERPWRAHRTHFYQRLVRLGWGHRKTVIHEYGLMLACACSAVAAPWLRPGVQAGLLGAWAAVYVVLMLVVAGLEREASA